MAMQIVMTVRENVGIELQPADLIGNPTIGALRAQFGGQSEQLIQSDVQSEMGPTPEPEESLDFQIVHKPTLTNPPVLGQISSLSSSVFLTPVEE